MACCYVGRGTVYLQKHDTGCPTTLVPWTTPLIEVGNTENLALEVNQNELEVKNYMNAAGGLDCTFTEIESVDLTIDTKCFKASNLSLALFGYEGTSTAGAVVNELHQANSTTDFIPFNKKYDPTAAVVVTGTGGTPTYVAGTDYVLTPNGIKLIAGGAITAGTDLEIDYTALASTVIQGIIKPTDYYTVVFDGVNAVDNQPLYMKIYKVRFNPTSLTFIGDDIQTVSLDGKVLAWECITSSNTISNYMIVRQ